MGNIQLMGKTVIEGLRGYEDKYAPLTIEEVAKNSIDWWLTTEDLPDANNQVRVEGDQRSSLTTPKITPNRSIGWSSVGRGS